MSASEIAALQKTINEGFEKIDRRLASVEEALHDNQQGIHGLMFKLLRVEEVNEIRAQMKNPPDLAAFPRWVIR